MQLLSYRRTESRLTSPVRVSFVIDRLCRAGTETQLLALLRHLDPARVRTSLCLLNGSDPESQALRPSTCPVLDLGLRRLNSVAMPAAAARLAGFWRRNRVDVVQSYFLDSTHFAVPLARLCGIRHVVRVRNNDGYWLTRRHRWVGRVIGRLAHVTLTNSDGARQSVLSAEGLHPDRVRVIENGVDPDRFADIRPPDTGASIVRVGTVANLRAVKNVDGLVRAAVDICRTDPRVSFEVAGDGPERPALETQIRAAGLAGRFFLRGSVDDIPAFLQRLDIAALPSHSESMSNALLEYMAAGRAVVATDVGANARLVRDGCEGLIVPARDHGALCNAICRLLGDPRLAGTLGRAAARRAADEFGRDAMARRFEAFYESLLTNRPAD